MLPKSSLHVLVFFRKRHDITEEQFFHYWENVHAPLVTPWAIKHGFKGYTLFQAPHKMREQIAAAAGPPFHGTLDYEAMADFEVDNLGKFTAAFSDPYYLNVIKPDEANFLDSKSTEVIGARTMGITKKIVEDGKAQIDTSNTMALWKEWEERSQIEDEEDVLAVWGEWEERSRNEEI